MSKTLLDDIKSKRPSLAKRALASPLGGIRLFCLHCLGGSSARVEECSAPNCPLFPFRGGKRPAKEGKKKRAAPTALLEHVRARKKQGSDSKGD